jgi:pyruvate formate lyase activating enzyme
MLTELMHFPSKCLLCGKCANLCPHHAIAFKEGQLTLDRGKCDLCGLCVRECFSDAWKVAGRKTTAQDLLDELLKDEMYFQTSEGGITVGGGEPFSQPEFLKEFLILCKQRGIHTAIETCGYANNEIFCETLPYIDVLLMDLKHMNEEKHREFTGLSNRLILDNWKIAAEQKHSAVARIPVIPGFNDTEPEISAIIDFLVEIGIQEVNLLPYHRFGEGKYEALGRTYEMHGGQPIPDLMMERFLEIGLERGLRVQLGG